MEEDGQASRKTRMASTTRMPIQPGGGSTTSSMHHTKMTAALSSTSSNGSSGHSPLHRGTNDAQSGASLLQARLRERRGRDMRMSADFARDMDLRRGMHSSPARGSRIGRDEGRPSSSGVNQPTKKPMGVKQMEEVSC